MKCVIKDNKLILPEGFCLPEKEMTMAPNGNNDVRIYTSKGWHNLCDRIYSIEDEHHKKMMLRLLFCAAEIIDGEKKEIELKGKMSCILREGEAELTVEDDYVVIKNPSTEDRYESFWENNLPEGELL